MAGIVLIVDDSQQLASTLEVALDNIPGLQVAFSPSGEDALRFLSGDNGQRVCALVTDLNMPRMDGYELIERLRNHERFSALPIIALSGDADPRTPQRAQTAGANAFFAKPYSPSAVRQTLQRLLNGKAGMGQSGA